MLIPNVSELVEEQWRVAERTGRPEDRERLEWMLREFRVGIHVVTVAEGDRRPLLYLGPPCIVDEH